MFSLFSSINFRNLLTKSKRKKCKFSRLFSCLTAKIAKKKNSAGISLSIQRKLNDKNSQKDGSICEQF